MAKSVRRNEVSEEDLYRDVRTSAIETIEQIRALNAVFKEQADILEKELSKALMNTTRNLQKFTQATQKATKLRRESIKLDKQENAALKQKATAEVALEKIKREKLKTEREELRNAQLLQRQKDAQARAQERAKKAALDEANAYKVLSKKTREQKNESKRLSAEMLKLSDSGKRNTKEYRALAFEYRNVTTAAKRGDAQLKKIDATVGDNFRNVGNYKSALEGLRGTLVRLAGGFGAVQFIRNFAGVIVDFDQAQADLAAISGKTSKQLEGLTEQAKELGATTQFSATQITEMQTELAKLGFTVDQIQASTKAVGNFAAATGAEIPEAAALAGAALRSFELDASEMARVTSVLGVATTKSALDFEKLNNSLATVAPVANSFGFSIEDTTALLGQLSNAGFDASSAATATRNILLNLADANGDLAVELGRPVKTADDLAEALQELDRRNIDLASALELTDKRSVAAFSTFIKGSGDLVELRDSITDVSDELEAMADKRLDTISGQFTLLQSAWEGWILSVNEGSGAGESVKELLSFLANNLPQVISFIGKLVKLFLIYKARIIALNTAQKLFNAGSGKMSFNLKTVAKNLTNGSKASLGFAKAMKGVGWTALIGLALELANAFYDVATGADVAAQSSESLERRRAEAERNNDRNIKKIQKLIDKEKERLELQLANKEISEEEAAIQFEKFILSERQINAEIKRLRVQRDLNKLSKKEANDEIIRLRNIKKEREELKGFKFLDDTGKAVDAITILDDQINALIEAERRTIVLAKASIATLSADGKFKNRLKIADKKAAIRVAKESIAKIKEFRDELEKEGFQANVSTKQFKRRTVEVRKANTEFSNQINLIKELNEATKEQIALSERLRDVRVAEQITEANEEIDRAFQKANETVQKTGKVNFEEIQDAIDKRKKIEVQAVLDRRDAEILARRAANEERINTLIEAAKKERDKLLAQDKLTAEDRKKIEDNFQEEMRKIGLIEEANAQTVADAEVVIKEQSNNEILDIERRTAEEIKDIKDELNDAQEEFDRKRVDQNKKTNQEILDQAAATAARRRELAQALTDFLLKQSQRRIDAINEEIQAAEKQADFLREMAAQGNIEAQQSLAENQRLIAEANRRKAEEERRQQQIKLASTAYDIYQSKVEAGSETPLADTITDISLLQAFINSLPAFEKGIENTGDRNGHGVDGRGGFHAILHPNEKVMNADDTAKVPAWMSNAQLAQLAQDYDTGKLVRSADSAVQIGGPWESAAILGKLDKVAEAIDGQDFGSELDQVTDHMAILTTKRRKGNQLIVNKRRIDT